MYSLQHYRIPDGATLELSMHARTQTELEQLKQVRQVRVRTMDGKVIRCESNLTSSRPADLFTATYCTNPLRQVALIDGVKPSTKVLSPTPILPQPF